MATRIRPDLKDDLARYGAGCVDLCFNCGNCTAVCPLSREATVFPRKLVRYAQLGLRDKIVSAPEPWLCYYCGECSATCPKEATPGETMAALRRYATAQYDPTGLSGLLTKFPFLALVFTIALGIGLGMFHLSSKAHRHGEPAHWAVFDWIPYETIHQIGVIVGVLMVVIAAAGFFNAARLMLRPHGGFASLKKFGIKDFLNAGKSLGAEVATLRRRAECADSAGESKRAGFRAAHQAVMWGFVMLGAATTLDFVFIFLLKIQTYALARPLGIIGGLVMLYGLLVLTWRRWKKESPSARKTTFGDAWLLFFLLVLDLTGFFLLVVATFGLKGTLTDVVLLVHSVMAMELVLLFTLTKIGHAVYRPMALFLHFLHQPRPAA